MAAPGGGRPGGSGRRRQPLAIVALATLGPTRPTRGSHHHPGDQGAVAIPTPQSTRSTPGARPAVRALASRRARTVAVRKGRGDAATSSTHSAVTPATWGQAMLVPLRDASPPPIAADTTPMPGPLIWANVLENGATTKPAGDWPRAATDTTPSAAAGSATPISCWGFVPRRLPLPAAPTTIVPAPNASKLRSIAIRASNMRRLAR